MQAILKVLIPLLFGLSVSSLSYSQQSGIPPQFQNTVTTEPLSANQLKEDTVSVSYFTLRDISTPVLFKDTTLRDFEKYAELRSFQTAALNLGNLGSSHLPIVYRARQNIFTDDGFHQYDFYKINLDDFRYYKTGKAFNDLFFTPVDGQDNFKVNAKFSTNFQNNLNLSVYLNRISQLGFYNSQATKSTAFGFGLWKNNTEKNHQLFFTFLANNHNEEQNGGIIAPSEFRVRITEPTYLRNADTRHQNFQYALDNFFNFKTPKYKAHHRVHLQHGYYHFADDDPITRNDTLIYTDKFITDEKGLRYFMGYFKAKNDLSISLDTKRFGLKTGVMHQWSRYTRDLDILNINDAFAYAEIDLALKNIAQLKSRGELGIGSNSGNIRLDNKLSLRPIKDLSIEGRLQILRYDPSVIHESLTISETLIYENEFSKINEFLLGGTLKYDKLNLELEFNSGLIDNPIYYDTIRMPLQKEGSTEYVQAMLTHKFFWRYIGIENSLCYQEFTDNVYLLPDLYSIHNIYVQIRLFRKNLLTRIGGLYYFTRLDRAIDYFPITGTFYPSTTDIPSGRTMNNYPYMEAYANFKIKDFRLFIKVENLNDLIQPFDNGIPHYQVVNYPQFDWKLRMGVRWLLKG